MIIASMLATAAVAVPSEPSLVQRLVQDGYENVAIATREGKTIVWYEDRRSLDATQGLGRVARMAADTSLSGTVEFVPLHEQLPLLGIRVPLDLMRSYLQGQVSEAALRTGLDFDSSPPALPQDVSSPSTGRPELSLTPGYAFSDKLFLYLNGNGRMQIAKGWHALGRLQLQAYPGLDLYPTFGLVGGHHPLGPGIDGAWSFGRWSSERYGAEGELAGLLGAGEWQWSVRASLVTNLVPSAVATLEYRYPWLDMFTRAGGGFFPAGDRAVFLSWGRMFPRSDLEFGYFRSDYGNQLRASLTTYLGPGRRPDPRPLMMEVPGWYTVDYRASAPQGATVLWPEPEAGIGWHRLTPDYIRRHLGTWRANS